MSVTFPLDEGVTVGVNANSEYSQGSKTGSGTMRERTNFGTYGGSFSKGGGWSVGRGEELPVLLDLRPVPDLLSPIFFDDPAIYIDLRKTMTARVLKALQGHRGGSEEEPSVDKAARPEPVRGRGVLLSRGRLLITNATATRASHRRMRSFMRRLAMQVLAAVVAVLLLAGAPAMAVLPPPFQAAVDAFDNRLTQGSLSTSDVALGQTVEKILQRYLEKDFPQNAPGAGGGSLRAKSHPALPSDDDCRGRRVQGRLREFRDRRHPHSWSDRPVLQRRRVRNDRRERDLAASPPASRRRNGRGSRENRYARWPDEGWSNTEAAWERPSERFEAFDAARKKAYQLSDARRFYGDPDDQTAPRISPGRARPPFRRSSWVDVFGAGSRRSTATRG